MYIHTCLLPLYQCQITNKTLQDTKHSTAAASRTICIQFQLLILKPQISITILTFFIEGTYPISNELYIQNLYTQPYMEQYFLLSLITD